MRISGRGGRVFRKGSRCNYSLRPPLSLKTDGLRVTLEVKLVPLQFDNIPPVRAKTLSDSYYYNYYCSYYYYFRAL